MSLRRLDGDSHGAQDGIGRSPRLTGTCLECGRPYAAARANARFCSSGCSRAFNNRRAARGVLLYDLFMTLRCERRVAKALKAWRALCRLAQQWRAEDLARRDGRRSWCEAREVLAGRPYLVAERGPTIRNGRAA